VLSLTEVLSGLHLLDHVVVILPRGPGPSVKVTLRCCIFPGQPGRATAESPGVLILQMLAEHPAPFRGVGRLLSQEVDTVAWLIEEASLAGFILRPARYYLCCWPGGCREMLLVLSRRAGGIQGHYR